MLGAGAGTTVRWLVTITGEPGSSVAFATNSNATSAKPTTAKKLRAGIAAWSPAGMSACAWPKRIGGFSRNWGLGVPRLLKPYDAGSIGVAENLNEWLTPSDPVACLYRKQPAIEIVKSIAR
jgi:hypothetical protein